jgi:rare lipoprotein A
MSGRNACLGRSASGLALLMALAAMFNTSCAPSLSQTGIASYYGNEFSGRKTASGEKFRQWKRTAAHPDLPFGTKVKVTNLKNGCSVKVRINDRGPFVKGRMIDLSRKAARKLDMLDDGLAKVKIKYRRKKK